MTGFCKGSCWFLSLSFQTLCMRIISNTEKHPLWNKHHVEPTYVFWDSSVYFLKVCISEQRYLLWVFWSHIPNQHWLWLPKEVGRGEDGPPLSPLFKSCPLVAHAQFSNNKPTWQRPHYSCCLPLTLLMTIQGSHTEETQATHLADLQALVGSRQRPFQPAKTTAGRQCLNKPYHAIENFPTGIIMQGILFPTSSLLYEDVAPVQKDARTSRLKQF